MIVSGRVSALLLLAVGSLGLLAGAIAPAQTGKQATTISFQKDILPILSDKCFKCHGPDSSSRKAGLRLDTSEGAYGDRGGRWPIVPGKPEASLVVQRLHSADDPMPPADSGRSLTDKEKSILTQWINEGARYSKLWSFEPLPSAVPVPLVSGNWAKDDIDRFVLQRLNVEKLSPSKPASKERWLRRVTFDLAGLPPSPSEIESFLKDNSSESFDHVVDRLLSSQHFGERMAVEWLDAARYSDSYGYQSDLLSPTWPYRDWVVRSFNNNLPYDKFLRDQIAGDLLKSPTQDQKLATAFNRLHRQSNEGGSIAQEFKTVYAADRVDTFGTAVLGLTLGCARCHDHKFDPITQREYYQLYAYFNSIKEYGLLLSSEIVPTPSLLLPTPEQTKTLDDLRRRIAIAKEIANQVGANKLDDFNDWLQSRPVQPEIPDVLAHFSLDSLETGKFVNDKGGAPFAEGLGHPEPVDGFAGKGIQFDGESGLAVRGLPAKERWEPFSWSFRIQDPGMAKGPVVLLHRTGGTDVGFCGFDLMLEDGYLTARVMRHWPGNAVAVKSKTRIKSGTWTHVGWSWDGCGEAKGLQLYIDGQRVPVTVLNDKLWKKINAYGDLGPSGGDWCFGQRFRDAGFKGGKLDDVTFANRNLSDLEFAQLYDGKALTNALKEANPSSKLQDYYNSALSESYREKLHNLQDLQKKIAEFEDGIYEVSVMEESQETIPAYVLARGQYDAPKNEKTRVVRGVPGSLPPVTKGARNDRLALANWTTRPDNPLTARVAVNRIWQMIFGTGLVETSENFGSQGAQPSHPELLDYLSKEYIDSGWNTKALVKRIVLSATYRQDSSQSELLQKKDPRNRLLARGPSNRLSAEMIRDTVLAASGLLEDRLGGPPVNPYQPAGIWQENNTMSPGFVQSKGKDLYRRSIYSTWKRTTPVPSMMLFDATSREACTVRRPSTNTPLQALVLLNDVQFVEAARVLGEMALKSPGALDEKIKFAFLKLAGRQPSSQEVSVLARTYREQLQQFTIDQTGAMKLIALGDSKCDHTLPVDQLAAMTVTMQTIINSDAVVWKR